MASRNSRPISMQASGIKLVNLQGSDDNDVGLSTSQPRMSRSSKSQPPISLSFSPQLLKDDLKAGLVLIKDDDSSFGKSLDSARSYSSSNRTSRYSRIQRSDHYRRHRKICHKIEQRMRRDGNDSTASLSSLAAQSYDSLQSSRSSSGSKYNRAYSCSPTLLPYADRDLATTEESFTNHVGSQESLNRLQWRTPSVSLDTPKGPSLLTKLMQSEDPLDQETALDGEKNLRMSLKELALSVTDLLALSQQKKDEALSLEETSTQSEMPAGDVKTISGKEGKMKRLGCKAA